MLEPRNRRYLLDSLKPPLGYVLGEAIATTFSLDLTALLITPMAFTRFSHADESVTDTTTVGLFEAIRRHASRITVFCQSGQIKVPPRYRPLFLHLEQNVVEVIAPRSGVFHPKLWLLRYDAAPGNPDQVQRYRLLCSSRNLTFDPSWDTLLVLDGFVIPERSPVNDPLLKFLSALPGMAKQRRVDERTSSRVAHMVQALEYVHFEVPPGFETMQFHLLGLDGSSPWPFRGIRANRVLIVSPFLKEVFLRFTASIPSRMLISREEDVDRLPHTVRSWFDPLWILDRDAQPEDRDSDQAVANAKATRTDDSLRGLHAKLYALEEGYNAHLFTGSPNASNAAFGSNVEFLVHLTGKKSQCGIDKLIGSADSERGTLREILVRYQTTAQTAPEDKVAEGLEKRLADARAVISSTRFLARAEGEPGQGQFKLTLTREAITEKLNLSDCHVMCWPITLPPASARLPDLRPGSKDIAQWLGLGLGSLTPFFAFELTAVAKDRTYSTQFVITATLSGGPANREEQLLQQLLDSTEKVVQFILLLLSDDEPGALSDTSLEAEELEGQPAKYVWQPGYRTLLEPLARALVRDPVQLDEVHRLITDLRKTPSGAMLLPPEFDAIWNPIWEVRQGLKS